MAREFTGLGTAGGGLSSIAQRAGRGGSGGARVGKRGGPLEKLYLSQLIPTLLILIISVVTMWSCSLALPDANFTSHLAGIALGAACSKASDYRVDTRVMFSAGLAAQRLGMLGDCRQVYGVPVSVSSKSPFFDRATVA